MKHYKLVEFLLNSNAKPPLHERKAPRTNVKPPQWRLSVYLCLLWANKSDCNRLSDEYGSLIQPVNI